MKRARIAVIHPQLRVGGGSEACALWIVEALCQNYDVSLISGSPANLSAFNDFYHTSLEPGRVSLISVPPPAPLRNPNRLAALRQFRLSKFCKRVSSRFEVMFSAYSPMDFGKRGIQYVLDPHFNEQLLMMLNPSPKTINRLFYKDSLFRKAYLKASELLSDFSTEGMRQNLTLVDSNWTGRFTRELFGIETLTVYPPVLSEYPSVSWAKRENGFICLGRIVPQKQIERAIEIVGKLRRSFPDLHLHILGKVGHAGYADSLRKLIPGAASWLHFEGDPTWKKKTELIAKHRYGIHAKENEPFGIAVAEMVAAGCIVWVPDGGGQVEIVDHPGLIYSSPEDGRQKIERILKDSGLRDSIRRHLARRARQFSVKKFQGEIRGIVDRFLSVPGPRTTASKRPA